MQAMKQDELNEYLNSLAVDESFRIEETLKGSTGETTQIVSFVGGNGSGFGPFIRKTMGQSLNLWDLGFSTYLFLLESMIFRKKYSSSG